MHLDHREECAGIARIADPARRAEAYVSALARRRSEMQSLMDAGMSGIDPAHAEAAYLSLLGYRAMERRFQYQHRLHVQRRPWDGRSAGAYPFRDARHDVVRVLSAQSESRPALSGRRYPYEQVEPFAASSLRCRSRAALYLSQLRVRQLTPGDIRCPGEQALVGQWGLFARRDIPAGTCIGIYGGMLLSAADARAVVDRRYLLLAGSPQAGVHINGETMLCLANSLYLLDASGQPCGHPDGGYNAELGRFPARLAHGHDIDIPAMFTLVDVAAGDELRWNYASFRAAAPLNAPRPRT